MLVAALVAAGCSSGSSGGGAGKPKRGGVLRIGVTSAASLDPAQARTVEQLLVADQLFDGLTAFDVKSKKVVPALADAVDGVARSEAVGFLPTAGRPVL